MTNVREEGRVWQDFDLVQSAARYAEAAHRDDLRKGSGIPYVSHLWGVAANVLDHGGDDVQVASALLHDVVEDHGGTERLADVRERFGPDVAAIVEALSDSVVDTTTGGAKPPWAERKVAYVRHLATVGKGVALVSASDKLHNLRAILADYRDVGPDLWERFSTHDPADHLWYYRSLVSALADNVPPRLRDELQRTFDDLMALVRADEPDIVERIEEVAVHRQ